MKWKKHLYQTSITLILFTSFLSLAYADWEIDERWEIGDEWIIAEAGNGNGNGVTPSVSYSNYLDSHDGNCLMYGGIQLKPNTIHTYIPQFNGRYKNITLDSGTLGLSKSDCAYNIACSTNDNVTINLNKWFYSSHYNTEFQPNAETESTLTFTVNTRERGEPHEITGVSTWSYNEDTTTLTLTCANYSRVSMWFLSDAEKQFIWITVRIPTWMGIAGIGLIVLSPVMIVYFIKEKEYEVSMIIALMGFALGFAMIVAWLWG